MKATRPAIRQNVSRRSVLGLLGFGAATALCDSRNHKPQSRC